MHVAAECSPFVRTGGLGEAVAGLADAQARAGHRVMVFAPLYAAVRSVVGDLTPIGPAHSFELGARREDFRLLRAPSRRGEPEIVFVDAPQYFARTGIYGDSTGAYQDNARRFALLSIAALIGMPRMTRQVSVLHAHDWHTALAPIYLRTDPRFVLHYAKTPTVLSVHNAAYQGTFPAPTMEDLGLRSDLWAADKLEAWGEVNLLKGGLALADLTVTVSPSHAAELVTDVGGFGLAHHFRLLGDRLVGITNGIDQEVWDPGTDSAAPSTYASSDLSGKAQCKAALQCEVGLPRRADVPLFAMSARLVQQKGFDLVLASRRVWHADAQFVFLGAGDAHYRDALLALARERPANVATQFDFTDLREHRLLAGADFLLMPCLYEPCGLTQMRAQRYGVPVVARNVGGLRDTIIDGATGFLFADYSAESFDEGVDRALQLFADPAVLQATRRSAMSRDFAWERSAAAYLDVYERAAAHAMVSG